MSEVLVPFREVVEEIRAKGGDVFSLCYQCGLCDALCPWNQFTQFSMRRLLRESAFGLVQIEEEELWRCTTCARCVKRCPRGVDQIGMSVALRRVAAEYGVFPEAVKPIRTAVGSLLSQGNPLREERAQRAQWAEGLGLKEFEPGTGWLYFACCYTCYDQRLKKVSRAATTLLMRLGVDFGILGERESCCGESVRKLGEEEVFKGLAKANIKAFVEVEVKAVVVSSPHCLHALKTEYPSFGFRMEVRHVVELLHRALTEGKFRPSRPFPKRAIYHDPCYLGRHNGIYREPRELLRSVPGLELLEFDQAMEDSLCCGMGGGRVWMETKREERFANRKLEEAVAKGAQVLVTACPYCVTAFEDSRAVLGLEEKIEVKDLTEVLLEAL